MCELVLSLTTGQQHTAPSDALHGQRGLSGHGLHDRGRSSCSGQAGNVSHAAGRQRSSQDLAVTLSADTEDVGHAEDSANSLEQWTPRSGAAMMLAQATIDPVRARAIAAGLGTTMCALERKGARTPGKGDFGRHRIIPSPSTFRIRAPDHPEPKHTQDQSKEAATQ